MPNGSPQQIDFRVNVLQLIFKPTPFPDCSWTAKERVNRKVAPFSLDDGLPPLGGGQRVHDLRFKDTID
jgi:hypothetical protein